MSKIIHAVITLFVLMMTFTALCAQPVFPENGPLYNNETVPRIDITIDHDTLGGKKSIISTLNSHL